MVAAAKQQTTGGVPPLAPPAAANGTRSGKPRRHSPASALLALDMRLSNALFRVGGGVPRALWRLFEFSGDGLLWLALALGCALAPATPPPLRAAWANFLAAWVLDLALVGAAKGLVRRPRPVYNHRGDFVAIVAVDRFSFPSGHSSRLVVCDTCPAVVVVAAAAWGCLEDQHYIAIHSRLTSRAQLCWGEERPAPPRRCVLFSRPDLPAVVCPLWLYWRPCCWRTLAPGCVLAWPVGRWRRP